MSMAFALRRVVVRRRGWGPLGWWRLFFFAWLACTLARLALAVMRVAIGDVSEAVFAVGYAAFYVAWLRLYRRVRREEESREAPLPPPGAIQWALLAFVWVALLMDVDVLS